MSPPTIPVRFNETIDTPLSVDEDIWPKAKEGDPSSVRVAVLRGGNEQSGHTDDLDETRYWPVLGYDVADEWLVSGLVNCGYAREEKQRLSKVWIVSLTRHGLFRDANAAIDFVKVANERVPEHAPFFVYELRSPDVQLTV